jgi:3-methyladenine DNA glycosylase AlkD
MSASGPLVRELKQRLRGASDPSRAPVMQAYMKSQMPYLGIAAPPLKAIVKEVFAAQKLQSREQWRDTILSIWRKAKYREERYAAIALAGHRDYETYRDPGAIPMYEEMIVTGAWWDYVDTIASHHLGPMLRAYRRPMRALLLEWAHGADIWKRRSAILSQLGFRQATDLKLLYACIQPSLGRQEFFLRKGIGWALRQYAWTDSAEIVRYVGEHERWLSPLSRREALKNITKIV